MRFHGVMLLRDERDIIVENLQHLLTWIDTLCILDLGSTDGTWEVVQDFAAKDKRIVPFKRSPIIYTDNLRSMVFDHSRERFDRGDWIMKIDADEFYHVPPPVFVKERLGRFDTAAWLQWYFFRLTQGEVSAYESNAVNVVEDRKRPIQDRRRFYKISEYSEPRMFKYRPRMKWPANVSFPFNAGYVSRIRIPIRHYPHRDPLQMRVRFRLRAKMMSIGAQTGQHWTLDDWRAEIVDEKGLAAASHGKKRGLSGEAGIDTGELHYWPPGTELIEQPLPTPYTSGLKRIVQRCVHPMLLPVLDARREAFDKSFDPQAIPFSVQQELEDQR